MKSTISFLFLILIPSLVFSQREDSTKYAGQKNPWISILQLDYDNIETVETVTSDYWVKGNESKLYVYTKDEGVRYFQIFTPKKGKGGKRVIKEKRLNKKQQRYYVDLLRKVRKNNFTNINKSQLNITQRKNGEFLKIESGTSFRFRYIGYDYYKDFYTYAPQKYVDNRYPGWMERVKLLSLIIDFNKMAKRLQVQ
jgi:hypothetical protein